LKTSVLELNIINGFYSQTLISYNTNLHLVILIRLRLINMLDKTY
jgi:hypothetical protein